MRDKAQHSDKPRRSGAMSTHRNDPTWRLTVSAAPDAARADHHASLFALCNGRLGVRGGFEEITGGESFLSEVFDRTPIAYHERFTGFARHSDTRVPVADGAQMLVTLKDGEPLGEIETFEHSLDLATGRSFRRTIWRSRHGARIEITAERVLPREDEAVLAIRLTLASLDYRGPVELLSRLVGGRKAVAQGEDPRFGAGQGARLDTLNRHAEGLEAWITQRTGVSDITVATAQTHRLVAGAAEAHAFVGEAETCGARFTAELEPGAKLILEKVVAWTHAEGGEESFLVGEARDLAARNALLGFDALADAGAEILTAFWDQADIDAPATPELAAALRYNLYQLRQNAPRDGKVGIAAKGISGEGYEGHCFWDAEVFATPVLAVTAPELARSQLMFRSRTLERARAHAREMNHGKGALYPWRTIAGDEASAYFPGGSAQYHINADVAFAVMVYDRTTGDEAFIADHGAEVVFETARIWPQIGAFDARRGGAFCICGVTGPDEYTALIDNDHYTNRMAQAHLDYAVELAGRLKRDHADKAEALFARLELTEAEVAGWAAAAKAMRLPVDPVLGVHPQDDTFLDKPRWDFEGSKDQHPLLLHYHPLTLYRHQVCKQASVVLAHALAASPDLDQKQRDFDYYEAVTVHDSTLSASSHAVLAADIGEMAKAAEFLRETTFVDLQNLHGNTDHGLHLAAAAGAWMALVWGWGGFRPQGEAPRFRPVRCEAVPAYAFRLVWRGRKLSVSVNEAGVTYVLAEGEPLTIDHCGEPLTLKPNQPVKVALAVPHAPGRAMLVRSPPACRIEAVLFDLDGVLTDTAHAHYLAWKTLADEIGAPFDEKANEALKGVDRMGSLDLMLKKAPRAYDAAERQALADRKNGYYQKLIEGYGPQDLFPGAREALEACKAAGLKTALVSASRNAATLVQRLGIAELFDHVVDAGTIRRGKPDPETYLSAAAALGIDPVHCAGIEDAQAGIAGLLAARMYAVGVGDPAVLSSADAVVGGIDGLRWPRILSL
ncbi:beta-phosphoglucomutase [Phenylobacterium montanum]|uniref:Beta-phosphoglucomutase n=1 Tax=Phenylobacterium montanum TaxID=2823693 RepID=A0A975FZP4_9CAUL|nr:beta-phosphoglucomutase [Caulobacter sp. S6]QUD87877.1 beta-phosphoglucomutase [Caulobacter sp. S6]